MTLVFTPLCNNYHPECPTKIANRPGKGEKKKTKKEEQKQERKEQKKQEKKDRKKEHKKGSC